MIYELDLASNKYLQIKKGVNKLILHTPKRNFRIGDVIIVKNKARGKNKFKDLKLRILASQIMRRKTILHTKYSKVIVNQL